MATRTLKVEIVGDDRNLQRTLGRSQKKLGGFGSTALKVGARAGAALGTGMATAGVAAVKLASDAEETASKFRIVFGKSAAEATAQLNRFSKATGTSRFELKEQAAGFQALIRPMGLSVTQAGKMSIGLTKLATDLASFNNTSVEDAMIALKSGLVGESEPLRRYGVQLSAARIQAFAYANGIAKTGAELTSAQKAQASYGLILKDTKLAQGDAVRTSGSFANQFKRLKATVTDTATEIGMKLLPIATKAAGAMSQFIAQFKAGEGAGGRLRTTLSQIGTTISGVVASLLPVGKAIGGVAFDALRLVTAFAQTRMGIVTISAVLGGLAGRLAFLAGAWAVSRVMAFVAAIKAAVVAIRTMSIATASTGIGALAVVIGTVVGALFGMKTRTDQVTVSSRQLRDALNQQADAARRVRDLDLELAQRKANVRTANVSLAQAEARVAALRRSGRTGTLEYRQAEADLSQARVQAKRAQRDLNDAEADGKRTRNEYKHATKDSTAAIRGRIATLKNELREIARQDFMNGRTAESTAKWTRTVRALRAEMARLKSRRVSITVDAKWVANALKNFPKLKPLDELGTGGYGKISSAINSGVRSKAQTNMGQWLKDNAHNFQSMLGGPGTAKGRLGQYERIGHRMGLTTTSGYRPGDPGFHGRNRARDLAGPPGKMLAYARHMFSRYGRNLLELIYTPMGKAIDNGRAVPPYAQADHYDHVHVAARHGRRSARVTKPTVHFAEEAPRHPEYYISTNPRDRARSTSLLAQATQEISGKRLAHFRRGGRTGRRRRRLRGIPGIFADVVRRMGLRGRQAAVTFEAMLRANAVEAGAIGRNPRHGDRDSLGVFQIRGMHGPAKNRMDPRWSARWFVRNAKGMYRRGMSAGQLAADVERPAAQFRGKYGQVPDRSVRGLVSAFQGGGGGGGKRRRRRRKRKKKRASPAQRLQERLEAQLAMAGLTPTLADDIAAQTRLTGFFGGQYREALKSKKPTRIKEAAEEYRSSLDALQQLRTDAAGDTGGADANQALIDAQNAATEEMRRVREEIAGMRAELAKQNHFASSVTAITSREAVRALSDVISGQLGGLAAHRGLSAGDGYTLAKT